MDWVVGVMGIELVTPRLRPEAVQRTAGPSASSALGLGCVKTPVCDPRVEILSRFRQLENQKYLRPLL